jgi:integrase/recombinase XerD
MSRPTAEYRAEVGRTEIGPTGTPAPPDLIELFVQERRYLKSVTAKTVAWYRDSFRAFHGAMTDKAAITSRIAEIRTRGVAATSVNTWLRTLNAYFRWMHIEGHATVLIHIPRLKEGQRVLATLRPEHIQRLVQFRPKARWEHRIHTVALLLLDSGMRIDEALSLRRDDVDFDNLLVKLHGKGQRERIVPISAECRKVLWKYLHRPGASSATSGTAMVFSTRTGTKLIQRNLLKEFYALGAKLGITGVRFSFHTMRHTFAVGYIRAGGDVFRLQRILGHASLEMTRRYVSLQVADLSAVHEKYSVLAAAAGRER